MASTSVCVLHGASRSEAGKTLEFVRQLVITSITIFSINYYHCITISISITVLSLSDSDSEVPKKENLLDFTFLQF